MVIGVGYTDRFLSEDEALAIVAAGLGRLGLDGKRVIVIIPDSTRSGPVPLLFRGLTDMLQGRVAKLDFLVALGTHIPMDDAHIQRHVGITAEERCTRYADIGFYNHNWQEGLRHIGTIPASEISTLSNGLMAEDVRVQVNARLFDYDQVIICGPVFPHEVAGFSGGNKYFFPGVSGADIINFTHWMAAVITNLETIGVPNAPVRRVIDRAAAMIDLPKSCFSMVVKGHDDLAGLYFGTPEESQAAAAELSSKVDIVYLERPVKTVLSVMPTLYDDIWTAGKGMYKMEPVVADGGTVIIYAPQIDEVSYTHGAVLDRIGYHVRDYFLAQMGRFADEPLMVMAHATQVKGMGAYTDGVEEPRIDVVLATGVPKERCDRINLGYMDPASIRVEEWMGREDEGILVVPRSGELLHRLRA
jgi:lactate racemase